MTEKEADRATGLQRFDGGLPGRITTVYITYMLLAFTLGFGAAGYGNITGVKYRFFLYGTLCYLLILLFIMVANGLKNISINISSRTNGKEEAPSAISKSSSDSKVGSLPQEPSPVHNTSFTRQPSFTHKPSLIRRISLAQKLVILFLIVCTISTLLSAYPVIAWAGSGRYEGLATILLYGLVFLAVSAFGTYKKIYLYALMASVLFNCVLASLQLAGGNPLGLYPQGMTYHDAFIKYNGEFLGTIGNADLFSAFLCLAIPLLACGAMFVSGKAVRISCGVLALWSAAILLLSGVSAGVVGLIGCAMVCLPLVLNQINPHGLKPTKDNLSEAAPDKFVSGEIHSTKIGSIKKAYLAMFGLGALGLVLIFFLGPFMGGTAAEIAQILRGNISEEFGSGRIKIWQNTLALVPEHWFFGGGPDTLAARGNITFSRDIEALGIRVEALVDSAHNEYLNWLVNTGIFGLGTYLAALLSSASKWFKLSAVPAKAATAPPTTPAGPSKPGFNPVVFALGAAVLCYCIQAFFCFSLCPVAPLFWICWGLLDSSLRPHSVA